MKFSSMRASAPRDGSTMGQIPSILSGKGLREASDSSKPGECSELAPGHMAVACQALVLEVGEQPGLSFWLWCGFQKFSKGPRLDNLCS